MIIGNRSELGVRADLNKWYIFIEILKCPPNQIGIYRPYIMIGFVKWTDHGEYGKFNGRKEKKIGGWREYSSPIGIEFKLLTYRSSKKN